MDVGHLARDADVVVVEIGEVLGFVFGVVKDLRQRFVAVLVGVDIGVAAFVGVLLQQAAAVPDEGGVSVRYWSRRVCLGVLWKGVCRTGRRRMSRSRYCRLAF